MIAMRLSIYLIILLCNQFNLVAYFGNGYDAGVCGHTTSIKKNIGRSRVERRLFTCCNDVMLLSGM